MLLLAVPAGRLAAQAVYGSITGTVFDPSGAAVPNAKVAITDLDRDVSYTTLTNESGNYSQTHLIIGRYRVRAEAPGFKSYIQEGVAVAVDSVTHVDMTLQTGEITQTLDVKEEVPLLKTERTDVSTTLSEKFVKELPTISRNFTQFLLLTPGTLQFNWNDPLRKTPKGASRSMSTGSISPVSAMSSTGPTTGISCTGT